MHSIQNKKLHTQLWKDTSAKSKTYIRLLTPSADLLHSKHVHMFMVKHSERYHLVNTNRKVISDALLSLDIDV